MLKGSTPALRLAGMRLAVALVEGLNPLDRAAAVVHGEAWKLYERGGKVGQGRVCACGCSCEACAAVVRGKAWKLYEQGRKVGLKHEQHCSM